MKVEDLKIKLGAISDNKDVQLLIFDENLEEQIIDLDDGSIGLCDDETFLISLSEEMGEILQKHEMAIFQRCLDNTPKEMQTKETADLSTKMFGYELKD